MPYDPRQDFYSPFWPVRYHPLTRVLAALGPFFQANVWKVGLLESHIGWVEVPPYGTLEVRFPGPVTTYDAWTPGNPTDRLQRLGIGTLYRCIGISSQRAETLRRLSAEDHAFLQRTLWIRGVPAGVGLASCKVTIEVPCGDGVHRVHWGEHGLRLSPGHPCTGLDLAYHLDVPPKSPCETLYRAYQFLVDPGDEWRLTFSQLSYGGWGALVRSLGGGEPNFE
jgi:hypothetical protein